ncbi:MAG: pseudouridine synthase [Planctomycetota bacterium]|jgi:tRNA pseudouridine65 synthase
MAQPPWQDFIEDRLENPLHIVFQDEHYVAVFKPAGLMVHRGPRSSADEPFLLQALRDQLGAYVYPIHRLDRPTAGLVVFGLHREAAAELGRLFQDRQMTKHYQALVRGFVEGALVVDQPLDDQIDDWLTATSHREPGSSGECKPRSLDAITEIRALERFEVDWPTADFPTSRFTLVEIQPHTGRWHQIRRHLNHIAHPVIGDHRHGDHRWNQRFFAKTGIYRMMLTAMRLDFRHPFTHEPMSLWVPRGGDFDRAVIHLRSIACTSS